jgi:cobalt-zinc-cadmium efflux system protein
MAHDHAGHSHAHHDAQGRFETAYRLAIALNLGFVAVEATFGVLANSMALLADAGHNLGDVLGLALAWGAAWLSRREPTQQRTYGYRKSSVLASLANAVVLLITVGAIAVEACRRLGEPTPIDDGTVIWVAAIGLVINGGTALLFVSGRHADLNLRGAFLHMAADAGVSLGVIVAAAAIALTGWLWLDPAASLVIAIVITVGAWDLLRQSVDMALDAVPKRIDPLQVRAYLAGLAGVAEVHDLHIWSMSTTETALTCHLVMPGGQPGDDAMARFAKGLLDRFGIQHTTIQVETHGALCELAPEHVV